MSFEAYQPLGIAPIKVTLARSTREPALVLSADDPPARDVVSAALNGLTPDPEKIENIALCGVPLEASRRPCPALSGGTGVESLRCAVCLLPELCTRCRACVQVCPGGCLEMGDRGPQMNQQECIRCFACVEICPQACLFPDAGDAQGVMCPSLRGLEEWLSTLKLGHQERYNLTREPAYLQSRELSSTIEKELAGTDSRTPVVPRKKKLAILGLAITTMQEHAAALVVDGKIAGCIEEERFRRRKHYGWLPPGGKKTTLCNDLSLLIEQAFCWRSIQVLCEMAGLELEDVDYIAVNGIPARYRRSYLLDDPGRPPRILKSDKLIFVPHHLAHAASTYRVSGFGDAAVFTVDGRGDRETAAFFRATSDGELVQEFDVLSRVDSSIGGVYETITRILGFGQFGQGSTMALASFGQPTYDLRPCLSVERHDRHRIHEFAAFEAFKHLQRPRVSPLTDEHRNLAASVQGAIEQAVCTLLAEGLGPDRSPNLCLAGGVSLNCRMNQVIREKLKPREIFVQPAAHDAGTALGAALEAHRFLTGENPDCGTMQHAHWGPGYANQEIQSTLERFGVGYQESPDVARDAARLVADGNIVCWFQGRMESGPRALGSRSILADPRKAQLKERLNRMKGREPWRPFAPSILAGREGEYFEDAFCSPFMLFTSQVKKSASERIPVVMHVDGTTRPQSVARDANPVFHSFLEHFEALTGLPLVVNTSFNNHDEPIVCTPADALASFLMLGADYLAMGDFLISRSEMESEKL